MNLILLIRLIMNTSLDLHFPGGASDKEPACHCRRLRDAGSSPGSGRYPGRGHHDPLQYSRLENPWTEEPGGLQSMGRKESEMTEAT